jgi:hypothetical protein
MLSASRCQKSEIPCITYGALFGDCPTMGAGSSRNNRWTGYRFLESRRGRSNRCHHERWHKYFADDELDLGRRYTTPYLKPGSYSKTIKKEGSEATKIEHVNLLEDQIARVDAELKVGRATSRLSFRASRCDWTQSQRALVSSAAKSR